jgi:hypothetical protein
MGVTLTQSRLSWYKCDCTNAGLGYLEVVGIVHVNGVQSASVRIADSCRIPEKVRVQRNSFSGYSNTQFTILDDLESSFFQQF